MDRVVVVTAIDGVVLGAADQQVVLGYVRENHASLIIVAVNYVVACVAMGSVVIRATIGEIGTGAADDRVVAILRLVSRSAIDRVGAVVAGQDVSPATAVQRVA